MKIQLSDHFTYSKLFRFTLPSIRHDGLYLYLWRGGRLFRVEFRREDRLWPPLILIMPFVMVLGGHGAL